MKVVTSGQMRGLEQHAAAAGLPPEVLMDNAGLAVAREAKRLLGGVAARRILTLVGPGNNGGDGLVAARHLHDWGAQVHLYLLKPRDDSDVNYRLTQERGIKTIVAGQTDSQAAVDSLLASTEVILDALFGTGKVRPLKGAPEEVLLKARKRDRDGSLCVFAVDLPSGLDADTGAVDAACLPADFTITLGYPKPGLFCFPGAAMAGRVVVADIGIPPRLAENIPTEMTTADKVRSILPGRPADANKGTFGRVLVIGGSVNYVGAAYLACAAAARVGAGLVSLAVARSLQAVVASRIAEVTYVPLPESEPGIVAAEGLEAVRASLVNCEALLLGCGLGQSPPAAQLVRSVLRLPPRLPPLILDADALNILAKTPRWWQDLSCDAVLTPHPGEMARLADLSVEEVQSRRVSLAREAAHLWQKTVVLKGAYTVVAAPDGRVAINPVANPGLATAGAGDVLAGAIAGLVAQGCGLFEAAVAAVYIHSQAGETVKERVGDAGMLAGDLLPVLPGVLNGLRSDGEVKPEPLGGW